MTTLDLGAHRARARRSSTRASRRTCGSTSSSRTSSSARAETGPRSRSTVELEPSTVQGVPATIERAVGNLLDNAAKWSPPGGEVEVEVRDGRARRARPRPWDRRRGPSVRLRPLLSSSRRSRDAGLGPRPRDRPPGRGVARRRCRRRACGRWRHAHGVDHRGGEPRGRRRFVAPSSSDLLSLFSARS